MILSEAIAKHDTDVEVLVPDFPAKVGPMDVIVQAVLERTAVVYPPDRVEAKSVVKLGLVTVLVRNLRWVPRPEHEVNSLRSKKVGRARALAQRRANKSAA
jgi:hypothetical protein